MLLSPLWNYLLKDDLVAKVKLSVKILIQVKLS